MKYEIVLTEQSRIDLYNLTSPIRKRIIRKLRYFSTLANPLSVAKLLKGALSGHYRFRVGDYRIIIFKSDKGQVIVLHVVKIGHRKEIYE